MCIQFEDLSKSLFYRVLTIGLFSMYSETNVVINTFSFISLRSSWGLQTSLMVSFGLEATSLFLQGKRADCAYTSS